MQCSGPIDPQDYLEYEDRAEAVSAMGPMDDLPQNINH